MSSYSTYDYGSLLEALVELHEPRFIVEFGILEGYSFEHLKKRMKTFSLIEAYDIFDEYEYRHADFKSLNAKHGSSIKYGDFWKWQDNFFDSSIDMLHIDISNTGDTYKHAINHYLPKIAPGGVMLLEGGSLARDYCQWMVKYRKRPIREILQQLPAGSYFTFEPYPSLTLIKK